MSESGIPKARNIPSDQTGITRPSAPRYAGTHIVGTLNSLLFRGTGYDKRSYSMTDRSNGYEGVAAEFLARRGSARTRSLGIGVKAVREWARSFPPGAAVIDLGCGPGFPITDVLVMEGLNAYAIDASPSFVEAFRRTFQAYPSPAKLSRTPHFSIGLSMASSHGG